MFVYFSLRIKFIDVESQESLINIATYSINILICCTLFRWMDSSLKVFRSTERELGLEKVFIFVFILYLKKLSLFFNVIKLLDVGEKCCPCCLYQAHVKYFDKNSQTYPNCAFYRDRKTRDFFLFWRIWSGMVSKRYIWMEKLFLCTNEETVTIISSTIFACWIK